MKMTSRLSFLSPLLVALVSASACSFQADAPDIEITQRGVAMAGAPNAGAVGDVSVTGSFALSPCDISSAVRMNSDVQIHWVRIVASGGVSNLDFIEFARVTMAAPAMSEDPTEIVNYARSDNAPSSSVIEVGMATAVDITSLRYADKVLVEIQVAGRPPERNWAVDVTLNLSGKIAF